MKHASLFTAAESDAIGRLGQAIVNRIVRDAVEERAERNDSPAASRGSVDDLGEQECLRAARVPAPRTFLGLQCFVDPELPDDVIEFRDQVGNVMVRAVGISRFETLARKCDAEVLAKRKAYTSGTLCPVAAENVGPNVSGPMSLPANSASHGRVDVTARRDGT